MIVRVGANTPLGKKISDAVKGGKVFVITDRFGQIILVTQYSARYDETSGVWRIASVFSLSQVRE